MEFSEKSDSSQWKVCLEKDFHLLPFKVVEVKGDKYVDGLNFRPRKKHFLEEKGCSYLIFMNYLLGSVWLWRFLNGGPKKTSWSYLGIILENKGQKMPITIASYNRYSTILLFLSEKFRFGTFEGSAIQSIQVFFEYVECWSLPCWFFPNI